MVIQSTRKTSEVKIRQEPGLGRLDETMHETVRDDLAFRTLDNARLDDVLSIRPGMVKVHYEAPVGVANGSWTLGSDHTVYAKVPSDAQLIIPIGGFALHYSFSAVRPSSGSAYILSTRVSGAKNYGPFTLTLSSAGVLTAEWRDSTETAHSIASSTLTANATYHMLFVYDPVEGTTRLYLNGPEDGTALTGLSATLKPMTDAVTWWFGVNQDGSNAPVSGTEFLGANDSTVLFTLRGMDPAAFVTRLRKSIWKEWNDPGNSRVLLHLDWDESSGTTLYDRSRFKNNGTITGSATSGAELVHSASNGTYVGVFDLADGGRRNVVATGGRLLYEDIRDSA